MCGWCVVCGGIGGLLDVRGRCVVCGGNRGLLDVGVSVLKRINYVFSRVVARGTVSATRFAI